MSRVLLVEDSVDCQAIVSRALHGNVDLQIASDVAEARRLLSAKEYELVLLDVELPDGNGFGFCSTLLAGSEPNRPRVIFLTGSRDIQEKLTGFSIGADDYITKPFEPLELKARVLAHLRARTDAKQAAQTLKTGNLALSLADYTAELQTDAGSEALSLTPTEFKLLHALAKNEGRILSRDQLLSVLSHHGEDTIDRTIDAHLSKLRKKLGACTHGIEAVYGIGYRWVRTQPAK